MEAWTPRDINDLLDARSAQGGTWALSGTLVALGTGRILANLRGLEEVVLETPLRPVKSPQNAPVPLTGAREQKQLTHSARIIVRKTLFYTQPTRPNQKMDVYRYRPTTVPHAVHPILSPATRVLVSRDEEGKMILTREGLSTVSTAVRTAPSRLRGVLSASWLYVGRGNAASPGTPKRPGVVEHYDYVSGSFGGVLHWVRVGRCPAWYGGGQCATYLTGRRLEKGWRGIDTALKSWMKSVGRQEQVSVKEVNEAEEREKKAHEEEQQRIARRKRRFLGLF